MKKCFVILLVMGCMLGLLYATDTYASLITNGGFETGNLTGWTITPTVGVYGLNTSRPLFGPPYWFTVSPYAGNYMAELRGDKNDTTLSQTFNLASNGRVNISFAYNLFAYDFPTVEEGPDYFIVLDNTTILLSGSLNDPVGLPVTTTGWQFLSNTHNLAAGSHTLTFYLEQNSPAGPGGYSGTLNPAMWAFVDAISATQVPEPSSLLLLGAGLAGLGILRRRVKK